MKFTTLLITTLVFGLVVNVATAWVIASRAAERHFGMLTRSMVSKLRMFEAEWWTRPTTGAGAQPLLIAEYESFAADTHVFMQPESTAGGGQPRRWSRRFDFETGWPFPSLSTKRIETNVTEAYARNPAETPVPDDLRVSFGASLPVLRETLPGLPLAPMWPGFVLNWGVFTLAPLLLALPLFLWHKIRKKAT